MYLYILGYWVLSFHLYKWADDIEAIKQFCSSLLIIDPTGLD
jgi:hypothetical protein